jgi:hypothetical protein
MMMSVRNPMGVKHDLRQAVDHEGEVLENSVTTRRADRMASILRGLSKDGLRRLPTSFGFV